MFYSREAMTGSNKKILNTDITVHNPTNMILSDDNTNTKNV